MMDYIKKLRACIRHLQEVETGHLLEKEQLQQQLDNDKEHHDAIGKSCMLVNPTARTCLLSSRPNKVSSDFCSLLLGP